MGRKMTASLKDPDAALRCILRPCGVRRVRLSPQSLRALPADLLTKPSVMANIYDFQEFKK
jgi:hypothetical protein